MDRFNSKHLIFLILATGVVSIKTYPALFTRISGRDSWIAMIIASILILFYFIFIIQVCKKTNCYNFTQIYMGAFGKKGGKFVLILFALGLFFTLIESAAVHANSMCLHMLVETPIWFFLALFLLPCIYIATKNAASVITATLIGITLITLSGINLSILTTKFKTPSYLLPVFTEGVTTDFFHSIIIILGLYGGLTIVLPYLSLVKKRDKLLKHMMFGVFFVVQMQIVAFLGLLMTFDIKVINSMTYPNLLRTQLVSYFRFLECNTSNCRRMAYKIYCSILRSFKGAKGNKYTAQILALYNYRDSFCGSVF